MKKSLAVVGAGCCRKSLPASSGLCHSTIANRSFRACLAVLGLLVPSLLLAQIVNIEERRITGTTDSTAWYGSVRLGASLAKVKDQILQFNTTAHVQYKKDPHLGLFLLDGRFLRAGSQDFTNAGFAHLRYNYKLSERLTYEAYTQAQYNRLLFIRLRGLVGTGLRYRFFKDKSGKNRLYAGTAYMFEYNEFTHDGGIRRWHRSSNYLSFTFIPSGTARLVSTTYFQPQFFNLDNFRFSTEWSLVVPLGKQLSFSTDFTLSIDRSLPQGAPVTTYSWMNSLLFRLNAKK